MIPLLRVFMPPDIEAIIAPLRKTLQTGWIGEGDRVAELEDRFQTYFNHKNVSLVNSCTSAIQLALRVAGAGPGTEVITTAMTCVATNTPIILAGADLVWADVNPRTGNIDPESVRDSVTERTRAIMIVHWGGYPCDIDRIDQIAKEYDLRIIEDCAHALGSTYHDEPIGTHSDYCCFSLQAIKLISTGDGGILTCKDPKDHQRVRSLRWFGIDRENRVMGERGIAEWEILEAGYKSQMNDLAATIGLAIFPYLERILRTRRQQAKVYHEELAGLSRVQLIEEPSDRSSAYWLFTLLVDNQIDFIRHLRERGIEASIVHGRNDTHPVFRPYQRSQLPNLDSFSARMVCIPIGTWLTPQDLEVIVEVIRGEAW